MRKVLVTGSNSLDMDSLACSVAYAHFLFAKDPASDYVPFVSNMVHPEVRFVCERLNISLEPTNPKEKFNEFVLVDTSEPKGLPKLVRTDDVIEVIDHRMFAEYEAFPSAKFRVEPVGAAATLVSEFFYFDDSVTISADIAALLLCAIYSNTVNFKADTTTYRDYRMKDWLTTRVSKNLPIDMYEYKSRQAISNTREALVSDAKDGCDLGLDESGVIFQIETLLAKELLNKQKSLINHMDALFPSRKYKLLLIQDARSGKTHVISANDPVLLGVKAAGLPFTATNSDHHLIIPKLTMRKSVQGALLGSKS